MKKVIVITGAGTGFGRLTAQTLALAERRVYATLRAVNTKNAKNAAELENWARERKADLKTLELDVSSEASARSAADS